MKKNVNYLSLLSNYLKRVRVSLFFFIFSLFVIMICALVEPFLWGNIVQELVNTNFSTFLNYILLFFIVKFLVGVFLFIKNFFNIRMEKIVTLNINKDLIKKIVGLELKTFEPGRSKSLAMEVLEEPHRLLNNGLNMISLVMELLKIVSMIAISFLICKDIGMMMLVALIVIYILSMKTIPYLSGNNNSLQLNVNKYVQEIYALFKEIKEIKNLGIKHYAISEFNTNTNDIKKKVYSVKLQEMLFSFLNFIIKFSVHSLIVVAGAFYYYKSTITLAQFLILEIYALELFEAVKNLVGFNACVFDFKASLKNVFDLFYNKKYNDEKYGSIEKFVAEGDLFIKNVCFEYKGITLLDMVNIEVKKNKKVALIDKVGQSRFLLRDILLRNIEQTSGKIYIDDMNIKDLSEIGLRNVLLHISEEPLIVSGTMRTNISLLRPDATDSEIVEVCTKVGIHNWFDKNVNFLDIDFAKSGISLSKMEKQIIAIARFLLTDVKVVLFTEVSDEITSDERYLIDRALEVLERKSTVIVFANDINSLSNYDEVITFENGKIIGIQTHSDLLKEMNIYSKIAELNLNQKEKKEEEELNLNLYENKGVSNHEHSIFSQIW